MKQIKAMLALVLGALGLPCGVQMSTRYEVECVGSDGVVKWRDGFDNLVVNVGLNDLLGAYFKGSSYTAAHYVGLLSATPTVAAGDTMASHAGWTEVTDYTEATREALVLGTVASQSVDNSASKAAFSINGSVTVGGAFVTTNSTKGGTAGTLYGGGAFAGGDKPVANGDTLNVTVTLTSAAA